MIDILCPTHKRPDKLNNLIESIKNTCDVDGVHLILYIDAGDKSYKQITNLPHLTIIRGEQQVLSKCWNRCFKQGTGKIVMHCSDDIVFETKGWDKIVIDHFKNNPISLLYGRDGHQDENCPTHSFTSREVADYLGYFVPPYFEADWNDVWLRDLYRGVNKLFYDPNIMTRHLHVNVDSKYDDETYELARERRQRSSEVWESKQSQLQKDIKKLSEL